MGNKIILNETTDPWRNLALEELIMDSVGSGDIILYLWQNQNTVVIGKNQNAWKECRWEQLEADGGRLARRSSGGGAVFHDIGNLNFTFAADPYMYDLERQLDVIIAACRKCGINAEFTGRNDITVDGRKFSGNAFRHTQRCSMQHGTLLIDTDTEKVAKYLTPAKAKLLSKGVASVRARIANLVEFNPKLTTGIMKQAVAEQFSKEYGPASYKDYSDFTSDKLDFLYSKYSSREWRYGLIDSFDAEIETRFPWGGIQIMLNHKNGLIDNARVYTDSMDPVLAVRLENILIGCSYGEAMSSEIENKSCGTDQLLDIAAFLRKIL